MIKDINNPIHVHVYTIYNVHVRMCLQQKKKGILIVNNRKVKEAHNYISYNSRKEFLVEKREEVFHKSPQT